MPPRRGAHTRRTRCPPRPCSQACATTHAADSIPWSSKRSSTCSGSTPWARWSSSIRSSSRSCTRQARIPRRCRARSCASSATSAGTSRIRVATSTFRSRTRTAPTCARSSKRRIQTGMASTSATTSSDALTRRFSALRDRGRRALVCCVTAGHPDPARSVALLRGLEQAGADVIEVGVPFSDPMADGPIIQASSQRALEHGMTLGGTLDLVRDADLHLPVVLFTYLNPLLAAGPDVLDRAAASGVHGVLVTDLPGGADPVREEWLGSGPLACVRLVAPTTPLERMREIAAHGSGFVYLISRRGVTGLRSDVSAELPDTIARLRAAATLPICVGFGISSAAQAAGVGRLADGIVVGSAIVKAAGESVD